MLTKTQIRVLQIFSSKITKKFSIKEVAELLKKPYPLVHRSAQELLKENFIIRDEKGLISINYRAHTSELSYVESIRGELSLKKDKTLSIFIKDVYAKIKSDFFVFLIFGSYVRKRNHRDIDILVIVESEQKVDEIERILSNLAENFTKKFHIQVISVRSAYEMLAKRDQVNVFNETLNNHLLLFGAENYYRILQNAR